MMIRLLIFPFRYAWVKFKKYIGHLDTLFVQPLYAFGNEYEIQVKGRVIEAYKQSRPSENKTVLHNLLAAVRRYAGSSVPDVWVSITFQGETRHVLSDEEGIVRCSFFAHDAISMKTEAEVVFRIQVHEESLSRQKQIKARESPTQRIGVYRFASNHRVGLVSDIDDTILISHATRMGKKFWLSISKNAYTRRPLPGISRLYRLISQQGRNPIFYVSSSDWNLYDMMQDFMRYRDLPDGTLLMQALSINLKSFWKSGGGNHHHKLDKIELLMQLYPGMKFILVGDSGQKDPELYAEVVHRHPARILAVYIREIKEDNARKEKLQRSVDQYNPSIRIAFVKSTDEVMAEAKNQSSLAEYLK